MNTPHQVNIIKNGTTCLATEGKFCDRNIAVNVNVDDATIREAGIVIGREQGRCAAWSEFWDVYQNNGNRTDYERAFRGAWWNDAIYDPKYIPKPVKAGYMYQNAAITKRVVVDTSQCTSMDAMFGSCKGITDIGTIDTRGISALAGVFGYMNNLQNIDLLILKDDGSQTFTTTCFDGDYNLKEIRIQGKIGNSLDMKQCQSLSYESIKSIVEALLDVSSENARELKLSQWACNKLSATQKAEINSLKPDYWLITGL